MLTTHDTGRKSRIRQTDAPQFPSLGPNWAWHATGQDRTVVVCSRTKGNRSDCPEVLNVEPTGLTFRERLGRLACPVAGGPGEQDALSKRIDRSAFELVLLMESGFARQVRGESWQSYQHEFGSAGGTELDIDTDSDLMRLATGGSAR